MKNERLKFYLFLAAFILLSLAGGCASAPDGSRTVVAAPENRAAADAEIEEALKLIEKTPDTARGYQVLAALYLKRARETGDFSLNSKAETAVRKALEIAPGDAASRKLEASLHLIFHRFTAALEAGRKLQKEFPGDAFVYGILTDAHVELGNYGEAVKAAQKMVDLKPNTASYARVAHLRSLHGDTDGALEMYKTAARTADPADRETQSWCLAQLGDELWKNGRHAEAEKVYDEALSNFPNYHPALAGKGRARAAQGDFETAVEFLTAAENRVPNVETAILLGDLYTRRGETEKAERQYRMVEIIEDKIGVNDDRKRLALLWADRGQRLDEALEIARRESGARKDIYTMDALAWTLYKKGHAAAAQTAIRSALRLKTRDARIFYHAGMIERELGRERQARRFLETALRLNPSFDLIQAETARRLLSESSGSPAGQDR